MEGPQQKKYVIDFPELLAEWDYDKNNQIFLYPDKTTHGSKQKPWWKCSLGHTYEATVHHRLEGKNCPYCANRKVFSGFNDLQTRYPEIAAEWHVSKNAPLLPTDIVGGSHKVVWWLCPQKHEYEMSVLSRTQGQKCPVCAAKRVIKGMNDLATTHPHFLEEWCWEKNEQLLLSPYSLTFGSTKKVWWRCKKCGYEWQVSPNNRRNTGCPYCAGKVVVTGKNDLATLYPEIAKKWHPTLNRKYPYEVAPFSHKKAWWVCEKDARHVFEAVVCHLTTGAVICPICAKQRIFPGINDLQTTHSDLMKEWDWERNNSANLYPNRLASGSAKKAYWICEKGHTWQASIASRACSQHCGCPTCAKDLSASFPEKAIAFYLAKCFEIEENKKFAWLGQSELDIYIDSLKLGIEYDGKVWHTESAKDLSKDALCQANGISLIRVREKGCPKYCSSSFKIERQSITPQCLNDVIRKVFDYIKESHPLPEELQIDVEKDRELILASVLSSKKKNSVASSILINEWNYERNGDISPDTISLGTHQKMWWKCASGHEWKAAVHSRSGKDKVGCPYCSGKKILPGYNDLATLRPELAAEWSSKNFPTTPSEVAKQSNKKFWWVCNQCGLEYETSPANRARGRQCPACGKKKTTAAHIKKVLCIDTKEIFSGLDEAAKAVGGSPGSIGNCCRGKSKTASGYHWKYLD